MPLVIATRPHDLNEKEESSRIELNYCLSCLYGSCFFFSLLVQVGVATVAALMWGGWHCTLAGGALPSARSDAAMFCVGDG